MILIDDDINKTAIDLSQITSTMMLVDNQKDKDSEDNQTIYQDFSFANSTPDFGTEQDVKIWVPKPREI